MVARPLICFKQAPFTLLNVTLSFNFPFSLICIYSFLRDESYNLLRVIIIKLVNTHVLWRRKITISKCLLSQRHN